MKKNIITAIIITLTAIASYTLGTGHRLIDLYHTVPIADLAGYAIDESGYIWFGLADVSCQLENNKNRSYYDIVRELPYFGEINVYSE